MGCRTPAPVPPPHPNSVDPLYACSNGLQPKEKGPKPGKKEGHKHTSARENMAMASNLIAMASLAFEENSMLELFLSVMLSS